MNLGYLTWNNTATLSAIHSNTCSYALKLCHTDWNYCNFVTGSTRKVGRVDLRRIDCEAPIFRQYRALQDNSPIGCYFKIHILQLWMWHVLLFRQQTWVMHYNGRRFLHIGVHRDCSSWKQCWTIWRFEAISSEGLCFALQLFWRSNLAGTSFWYEALVNGSWHRPQWLISLALNWQPDFASFLFWPALVPKPHYRTCSTPAASIVGLMHLTEN